MIWNLIYLFLGLMAGAILGVWFAREELERLADQLTKTRNRLFECGRKLAEAERHLHGVRG